MMPEQLLEIFPQETRLTHEEAAWWLYERAKEIGVGGLCVDVGVWCGWTSCMLALGGPTVLAVDTFRASDRWVFQDHLLKKLGSKREGTLDLYADLVGRSQLGAKIVAVQGQSMNVAQALAEKSADLVFLDADHSRAAVAADVVAWHAIVKPSGILCGDNWGIGEVREAVSAILGFLGWKVQEGPHEIWWSRRPYG